MKIGYAKLGGSFSLNESKVSPNGGEIDIIRCLRRLSEEYPNDEIVLVGKNSGEHPLELGYNRNVINPWHKAQFKLPTLRHTQDPKEMQALIKNQVDQLKPYFENLDAIVIWLGAHGSSNIPLPLSGKNWYDNESLAKPLVAFINYCSYLLLSLDNLKCEPIFLCPDPRNTIKFSELRKRLKYPVIAQYNDVRNIKHDQYCQSPEEWDKREAELKIEDPEGYREGSKWMSKATYIYSGLEFTSLNAPKEVKPFKTDLFGIISNENLKSNTCPRIKFIKEIIETFEDPVIHGKWSKESQKELGKVIVPIHYTDFYSTLGSFKYTWTLPASGSKWCTAKIWECFMNKTLCFIHPRYDEQNHALKNYPEIRKALTASSAKEVKEKIDKLEAKPEVYENLINKCYNIFVEQFNHYEGGLRHIKQLINNGVIND